MSRYGPKKWTLIARNLKGRIGKQCRERWHNHLNPNIKKTAWTDEEGRFLFSFLFLSVTEYSKSDQCYR